MRRKANFMFLSSVPRQLLHAKEVTCFNPKVTCVSVKLGCKQLRYPHVPFTNEPSARNEMFCIHDLLCHGVVTSSKDQPCLALTRMKSSNEFAVIFRLNPDVLISRGEQLPFQFKRIRRQGEK